MSDLANLLRVIAKEMAEYDEPPSWHQPIVEAADEIEKLRAELKHARRDALEEAERWHYEQAKRLTLLGLDMQAERVMYFKHCGFHFDSAAAIRALGENG